MKVAFYTDGEVSNFGDDLNRWLWKRVLDFPLDVEDGTLLLGIGTVISRSFVQFAEKYIVLSSGAGYDALPTDFGGPKWKILSVRGPLTAALLNLAPEKAITDGAILLRLLPECAPLPASERTGIAFMPHYETLPHGNWRQVCAMAGFEFLDPLAGSEETVQRIRGSKLVIADAMHAAIVADALRVPWIPLVLSPQNNSFKWLDWTLSLNLPYHPIKLSASTLPESIRNRSLRFYGPRYFLEDRSPSKAIEHCRRIMRLKSWKYWPLWRKRAKQVTYSVPMRIVSSAALGGFRKQQDESLTRRAAEQLQRVAETPSYLSDEKLLGSRLEQMAELLPKIRPRES